MHPTTRTDAINRDAICDRELANVKHLFYNVVDYDNATSYELESLVHMWYSAKLPILRVLSQSPSWDPERLCITSEKRVKVDYDAQSTYDTIYDIACLLQRYDDEARHHRIAIRAFYSNMDHDRDTTPQDRNRVSQDLADICALRLPHLKIVAGMKLTRALRAIIADADALDLERWTTISWHDVNGAFCTRDVNHGMQWLLARFGDCIHPRDQRVTLHLSIAPTDILYSSPIARGVLSCWRVILSHRFMHGSALLLRRPRGASASKEEHAPDDTLIARHARILQRTYLSER